MNGKCTADQTPRTVAGAQARSSGNWLTVQPFRTARFGYRTSLKRMSMGMWWERNSPQQARSTISTTGTVFCQERRNRWPHSSQQVSGKSDCGPKRAAHRSVRLMRTVQPNLSMLNIGRLKRQRNPLAHGGKTITCHIPTRTASPCCPLTSPAAVCIQK